jgi:hypothetical protein
MGQNCLVYTALFSSSREKFDGRGITTYQTWLAHTLSIFPNMLVFHDGSCDGLNIPTANLRKIEKNSLEIFSFENKVIDVLKTFHPKAEQDLTFRMPEYALIQYAKFELAALLASETQYMSFLWVDAGISRFMKVGENTRSAIVQDKAQYLLKNQFDLFFEIDLIHNINLKNFKLKDVEIGSSQRIISGTSFWVKSDIAEKVWQDLKKLIQSMLLQGKWDNEQVLLRKYMNSCELEVGFITQEHRTTGTVARWFSTSNSKFFKLKNSVIQKLLR